MEKACNQILSFLDGQSAYIEINVGFFVTEERSII